MTTVQQQPALESVGRALSLIPVGLKEAALDSPTFRATALHFSDQVEVIERWLEGYVKSTSKLVHEVASLEAVVNSFLAHGVPPANVSEAVLDHDYTLLAMRRYSTGARDFWSYTISGMKKMESVVVDPVKAFLNGELRNFKDARRYFEQSQKQYDNILSRYAGQAKTKEASSLREDAFQLHEARKAYLKACMDFCVLAPQLRSTLDKLIVRVFSDQWRDMKSDRELLTAAFGKWDTEMERIRGWSREMEAGERVFKRELQTARNEIEEAAESSVRPSRELDDYASSTIPYLGTKGPSASNLRSPSQILQRKPEKQGWLFLRTLTGKPTRTVWVRRWFYVKNGIFGWLVQGARTGGVEESERIGVLLCSVRAAFQEERRFCFEVKTKDTTILVQAETQTELVEWIEAFEAAKRKALEDPSSTDSPGQNRGRGHDAAFAINPPSAPEFAARTGEHDGIENATPERSSTLPVPGDGNLASRTSFDIGAPRRSAMLERDDPAAKIIQKLDLHRKTPAGPQVSGPGLGVTPSSSSGGIASLISASHNILPVATSAITQVMPGSSSTGTLTDVSGTRLLPEVPTSTLAPSTLAPPPAPTNLSKTAVIVGGELGLGMGRIDVTGGTPSGFMANLWGSSNWGVVNRLERGDPKALQEYKEQSRFSTPDKTDTPPSVDTPPKAKENQPPALTTLDVGVGRAVSHAVPSPQPSPERSRERGRGRAESDAARLQRPPSLMPEHDDFPSNYPLQLKTQDAQFRMLFSNVSKEEKLVMVFRAAWNPNNLQDFPGRAYVTTENIYFYSHHLGLVLISGISLQSINEVTAATGRDCDYLYLHLKEGNHKDEPTRVTVKTFLEPLRLLQRRMNFLVQNANSDSKFDLEFIITELLSMERKDLTRSPSTESWEDVSVNTPLDESAFGPSSGRRVDLRARLRIDKGLSEADRLPTEPAKFKLPSQPVIYVPKGMDRVAIERQFEISPKALFHVMFGDKSAVFQMLYHERRAQNIKQGPWIHLDNQRMRREFDYQVQYLDLVRRPRYAPVRDQQVVEVLNDHLCYVIKDVKTPWHLPWQSDFNLVSRIVITHVAKSRCKLTVYAKTEWSKDPFFSKSLVERAALKDLQADALDLADVITDQVRRLGAHSRTKKAIHIFGHVGQSSEIPQFSTNAPLPSLEPRRLPIRHRTLRSLLWENFASVAESFIISVLSIIGSVAKRLWKITSAHIVIIILLAFSISANLLYTSRTASSFWADQRASTFMSRLGIGPSHVMSKSIYLADIEELAFPQIHIDETADHNYDYGQESNNSTSQLNRHANTCLNTFRSITTSASNDASSPLSFSMSSSTDSQTASRLKHARQRLGKYRHDLLVAMRVVNAVERETLRAEWERWVWSELRRCERVGEMLTNKENNTEQSGRLDEIKEWYTSYCETCRKEREALDDGRDGLVFS